MREKLERANECDTYTSYFMEIQQKDSETPAAYIHYFKTAGKQCTFDNGTAAICIFVKELWDTSTITAKKSERDPQTLAEVIRLVEKVHVAHQLTATLIPSMVCMISGYDRCFICGWTGHLATIYPMPNVMTVMNVATLQGLPQQDSSLRNTTLPRQILFKNSI